MSKHFVKVLVGATMVLALFALMNPNIDPTKAQATATLVLSPTSNMIGVNQTFQVNINLNTSGAPIDGVDVFSLRYNPSILQVVDSNTNVSGVQIAPGNLLPVTVTNTADNTAGTIQFSQAASGGTNFTGSGVLATITFRGANGGSSNVTIDFTPGATTDSNISFQGADRLGSVTNASFTVDSSAPTAPTGLSATVAGTDQINLTWSASTDNTGVIGYMVEQCSGSACTGFSQIATPSQTSYSNSGLTASTTYRYRVRATDAAGNLSSYSSIVSATTQSSFDFSMSNGGARTVSQGSSVTNSVTATLSAGSAQSVSFSASGLPSGVSASFSPTSCNPTCSSTLTLTASSSATTGNSTITVTGTSGGVTRNTTFTLTVNQATYQRTISLSALEGRSSRAHTATLEILNSSRSLLSSTTITTNISGQATITLSLPPQTVFLKIKGAPFLHRVLSNIDLNSTSAYAFPTLLTGDVNQDNFINSVDFSVINANWFGSNATSDLNLDNIVNSLDFSLMNRNWFVSGEA